MAHKKGYDNDKFYKMPQEVLRFCISGSLTGSL